MNSNSNNNKSELDGLLQQLKRLRNWTRVFAAFLFLSILALIVTVSIAVMGLVSTSVAINIGGCLMIPIIVFFILYREFKDKCICTKISINTKKPKIDESDEINNLNSPHQSKGNDYSKDLGNTNRDS